VQVGSRPHGLGEVVAALLVYWSFRTSGLSKHGV